MPLVEKTFPTEFVPLFKTSRLHIILGFLFWPVSALGSIELSVANSCLWWIAVHRPLANAVFPNYISAVQVRWVSSRPHWVSPNLAQKENFWWLWAFSNLCPSVSKRSFGFLSLGIIAIHFANFLLISFLKLQVCQHVTPKSEHSMMLEFLTSSWGLMTFVLNVLQSDQTLTVLADIGSW